MKTPTDQNLTLLDALLREDLASFIQKSFYTVTATQAYLHN